MNRIIINNIGALLLTMTLVASCNADAAEMNDDMPQEGYYETIK